MLSFCQCELNCSLRLFRWGWCEALCKLPFSCHLESWSPGEMCCSLGKAQTFFLSSHQNPGPVNAPGCNMG